MATLENDGASASIFLKNFADPAAVAAYGENMKRFLPGCDALHRMAGVLLAESAPDNAEILVLGAGGGLELRALGDAQPGWRFTGVDPAAEMLRLAERTLGPQRERTRLVEGYIDDAPEGPYDGAVCLLTLHFLPPPERTRTIAEIHRRLRPGAPFVAAHGSFPQKQPARSRWLDRYAAYAAASGADPEMAKGARDAVDASDIMLDPAQDEALLSDGGFRDVDMFYAAFTWRGWIAYA